MRRETRDHKSILKTPFPLALIGFAFFSLAIFITVTPLCVTEETGTTKIKEKL